jgi:hypothetical protein
MMSVFGKLSLIELNKAPDSGVQGKAEAEARHLRKETACAFQSTNYFGKTYSQLAAGWWQYFMSLPTTNNPLYYIQDNPPVPMSTGQDGPV